MWKHGELAEMSGLGEQDSSRAEALERAVGFRRDFVDIVGRVRVNDKVSQPRTYSRKDGHVTSSTEL
ncbi:hypothetical protein C8Q74DRAFT_1247625 [Fomes fomentarius]|nr:hypothetical protein C8Q74DRAFT_1247625 [Fomes fomentarius]